MPQVLKDNIKEKILEVALLEFMDRGYIGTSMKSIAAHSGIAVGNIYRYFKSKEDLYDELVLPVYEMINKLFDKPLNNYSLPVIEKRIEIFINIYKLNSRVFMMLLRNSDNTKFADMKSGIINNFAHSLGRWKIAMTGDSNTEDDRIFLKAISTAYLNGIISILSEPADEEKVSQWLYDFLFSMKEGLFSKYRTQEIIKAIEKGVE